MTTCDSGDDSGGGGGYDWDVIRRCKDAHSMLPHGSIVPFFWMGLSRQFVLIMAVVVVVVVVVPRTILERSPSSNITVTIRAMGRRFPFKIMQRMSTTGRRRRRGKPIPLLRTTPIVRAVRLYTSFPNVPIHHREHHRHPATGAVSNTRTPVPRPLGTPA